MLLLRAAWKQALQAMMNDELLSVENSEQSSKVDLSKLHALHDSKKVINQEILQEKEIGESCLFSY